MASRETSGTLCRYFASGSCHRANCSFSHDRSSRPDNVCRYYLQGICFYGNNCRYDHVHPERDHRPTTTNTVQRTTGWSPKPQKAICPSSNFGSAAAKSVVNHPPGLVKENHPVPTSYAQAVNEHANVAFIPSTSNRIAIPVCQYAMTGTCEIVDCSNWHGDICSFCNCQVLDPKDEKQRAEHEKVCSEAFESDMDFSFAVQRSKEQSCSICFEVVLEQPSGSISKRRFGVLENCTHAFCFDCIMTWRKQSRESMDTKVLRSCPECRVHSDYVIPSTIWPDTAERKNQIILDYKKAMNKKPCRNFDQGRGKCLFGGKCWFSHTLVDGTKVDLPDPRPKRRVYADAMQSMFLDEYQLSEFLSNLDEEDEDDLDEDNLDDFDYFEDEWSRYGYDSDDSDDSESDALAEIARLVELEQQRMDTMNDAIQDISRLFEET